MPQVVGISPESPGKRWRGNNARAEQLQHTPESMRPPDDIYQPRWESSLVSLFCRANREDIFDPVLDSREGASNRLGTAPKDCGCECLRAPVLTRSGILLELLPATKMRQVTEGKQ